MSEIFVDTIRKTGGTLGTDIRIKNTSVYESDGGTSVTQNLVKGMTKSFLSFDGTTGTVSLGSSGDVSLNIATVTDSATGTYAFTYTNNMGTANHPISGSVVGSSESNYFSFVTSQGVAQATTGNTIRLIHSNSGQTHDQDPIHVITHGDLA